MYRGPALCCSPMQFYRPPILLLLLFCTAFFACDGSDEKTDASFYGAACTPDRPCPAGAECGYSGFCVDLGGRGGAESCGQLYECFSNCTDDACFVSCIGASTPAGIERYEGWVTCVQENECVDDNGYLVAECVTGPCEDAYIGCFGALPPGPMGGASCGELLQCLNQCDPAVPECGTECVVDSTPEAVDLLVAAVDCLDAAECMPGDGACQDEACGAEIRACVDDGLGYGSLTCDAIMECVFSCTDVECGQRCIVNGDEEALSLWRDFAACAGTARCNSRSSCFAVCPQQTQACAADR